MERSAQLSRDHSLVERSAEQVANSFPEGDHAQCHTRSSWPAMGLFGHLSSVTWAVTFDRCDTSQLMDVGCLSHRRVPFVLSSAACE